MFKIQLTAILLGSLMMHTASAENSLQEIFQLKKPVKIQKKGMKQSISSDNFANFSGKWSGSCETSNGEVMIPADLDIENTAYAISFGYKAYQLGSLISESVDSPKNENSEYEGSNYEQTLSQFT